MVAKKKKKKVVAKKKARTKTGTGSISRAASAKKKATVAAKSSQSPARKKTGAAKSSQSPARKKTGAAKSSPAPVMFNVGPLVIPALNLGAPAAAPLTPPGPMPPGVSLQQNASWLNYGQNLQATIGTLYTLTNGPTNEANAGLAALRWAVRDAAAKNTSLSMTGQRWSFSGVALNPAAMVDVRAMAKQLAFVASDLANPAELPTLVQVQAGTRIEQLITYAENAGMSLKAMGGNCGQTVAGALSTGTHGGFTAQPGFPDMARALYLVGEDGKRYWLERASKPVLSAALVSTYSAAGVVVLRDDALFNHAVVSLGAFGAVYAVVLDTTASYGVKLNRSPLDFDATLDAQTFDRDFSAFPQPVIDFATVVNPYRMSVQNGQWRGNGVGSAVRTVVFKEPAGTQVPPGGNVASPINDADLSHVLAAIGTALPPAIPALTDMLMGAMYGARDAVGPFPVAYPLSLTHAPTLGMELGVPGPRAREMFGLILDYIQGASTPLPGVLAIRQTTKSDATFSLARWSPTTTFEFCCLKVPGTEALLGGLLAQLEQQTIPFALHLGMLHGLDAGGQVWLNRARLDAMFGAAAVTSWVNARKTTAPTGKLFSNPLTRALGLTS